MRMDIRPRVAKSPNPAAMEYEAANKVANEDGHVGLASQNLQILQQWSKDVNTVGYENGHVGLASQNLQILQQWSIKLQIRSAVRLDL
jgi:hypothetical protein